MSCHSLLSCSVSVEKPADTLTGVSFYLICHFPLVPFNSLPLSLILVSLITTCVGVFLLGFILPGILCDSYTWSIISFPILGKFSATVSSNIFSSPFSLSSPSGTHIMQMFMCLILSQKSLRLSSILLILFSIFCSEAVISTILS